MRIDYRPAVILGVTVALAVVGSACAGGGQATVTSALTPTKAATTNAATGAAVTPTAATGATGTTTAAGTLGDPNAGKQLVVSKGCSGCHIIPGVPDAKGSIGPNLGGFAKRAQIAGTLQNTPDNMAKWLKNPPGVKPGTQMPNLSLSDQEITHLSAFLYTLN